MQIQSKPYGTIDIDPTKKVTIKGGLFGFEGREEYVIIGKKEEQPFEWLQSLEDPQLAFVIVPPQAIRSDYRLSLLEEDLQGIGASSEDELMSYSIVVVPDDPDEMTVNFRGPLVIHPSTLVGKQVVNQVQGYGVRHRILDELEETSSIQPLREGGTA